MPFKGSSTLVIKPCYDGRALPGTYNVAGDGLALLSIKDCHRNCTLTSNSDSKLPCLSCAQGIKPRNSFRNLLKPDVRKLKGIENPTTESIIKLFQTHNIEFCGSKSYKKKVLSKLGSIISKKSKTETQQQILVQNTTWPINFCVLSSLCQETEMVTPEILINKNLLRDQDLANEVTIKEENFEASNSNILNDEVGKETVFLTLPSFNMHENTSDDFIPASNLLDPSIGDSFTKTKPPFNSGTPRICLGYNSYDEASSSQVMSSSILLESKQSQHQISIPSNLEFYKLRESNGITMCRAHILTATKENRREEEENAMLSNFNLDESGVPVTEDPSSMVVQSIFSDIFQDIDEIKDAISSYMSSFYVCEEEYDNFPALHISSREVASHYFEQIHGSLRVKNKNSKNEQSTLSITEHLENGCLLEHPKEGVDIKMHKNPQEKHLLQENTTCGNLIKNDADKETSYCYCYWDDNELGNDKLSQNPVGCNISENNTEASLVSLAFVENMWEEFTAQLETHALFLDLVDKNEMNKYDCCERNFPTYGHWCNMYDASIFEDAENIVHTIDSLFMTGCFPGDENNSAATYIPCTIVELLDDSESTFGPVERTNKNEASKDENILTKQENQTSHKNEAKGNKNDNSMSRPPVNEIIDTIKIHEIKLEPVFNQEKVTIHEIDYSREPEYEKINLNPIIHQGRVSFSSLHSDSSSPDSPAAVETMKHNNENTSPNFNDKENSPQVFLRTNSKDQITPERYTEKSISLDVDKKGSDPGLSMFERIPEINSPGNSNPAFLFSSPTVQFNLNTFINSNRK